jgi:hypothetical protein
MKKIFLLSTVLLVVPVVALAQGFVPLAPIPGLTEGVTANQAGLASFFNNLYKFAIGIAAALAVIQIIWAGLDIAIFHKDAVSAITDDKGKIYNAVFGLVLVLSPVLVFSIINPSILNLSLNLPPLNTTSGAPISTTPASCPTGQGGTPPNCVALPPCNNVLRVSSGLCTPAANLTFQNEGLYPTPPTGGMCYELANAIPTGPADAGSKYNCYQPISRTLVNMCNQVLSSNSDTGVLVRKAGVTVCTQY